MLYLEKIRRERDFSKADVARGAQIDQAGYGRIERGFRKPYEPERQRLEEFFDIPAKKLFQEVNGNGDNSGK